MKFLQKSNIQLWLLMALASLVVVQSINIKKLLVRRLISDPMEGSISAEHYTRHHLKSLQLFKAKLLAANKKPG